MTDEHRPVVRAHFVSDKWGWVLQVDGARSVLYDGDKMRSWPTREAALEWARSNGYPIDEEVSNGETTREY